MTKITVRQNIVMTVNLNEGVYCAPECHEIKMSLLHLRIITGTISRGKQYQSKILEHIKTILNISNNCIISYNQLLLGFPLGLFLARSFFNR